MLSSRAALVIVIAALIYAVHLYATYHPKIRTSPSFWAIGIVCTLSADLLWTWLARSLNDSATIAQFGFAWEIAYKLIAVAIPVLLFNVQLTSLGYVGLALIIGGGFCIKLGNAAP
jgi:drug/metabolite transporter (DMT)-like permease